MFQYKTLVQDVSTEDLATAADESLNQHSGEGWEERNISVLQNQRYYTYEEKHYPFLCRIVTLRRQAE